MRTRLLVLILILGVGCTGCGGFSFLSDEPVEDATDTPMPATEIIDLDPPTPEPTRTAILLPTVKPTFTPTAPIPTATQDQAETPASETAADSTTDLVSNHRYGIQPGSPLIIQSWSHDCNWMGIGGQVFNDAGEPVAGIVVEVGGSIGGQPLLGLAVTGIDSGYGPGGYEIQLADQPIQTDLEAWIQLNDTVGIPISPKVYLQTFDNCLQNLVLLNFLEEDRPDPIIFYFPLIFK